MKFDHEHHKQNFTHRDLAFEVICAVAYMLNKLEERIMASLDETLAAVQAESTADDSIIALLQGLQQQLADALANANLSAENQAKVDAIFAQANANSQKIAAAVNTPPATA